MYFVGARGGGGVEKGWKNIRSKIVMNEITSVQGGQDEIVR
jgi:hypothetical protein